MESKHATSLIDRERLLLAIGLVLRDAHIVQFSQRDPDEQNTALPLYVQQSQLPFDTVQSVTSAALKTLAVRLLTKNTTTTTSGPSHTAPRPTHRPPPKPVQVSAVEPVNSGEPIPKDVTWSGEIPANLPPNLPAHLFHPPAPSSSTPLPHLSGTIDASMPSTSSAKRGREDDSGESGEPKRLRGDDSMPGTSTAVSEMSPHAAPSTNVDAATQLESSAPQMPQELGRGRRTKQMSEQYLAAVGKTTSAIDNAATPQGSGRGGKRGRGRGRGRGGNRGGAA